MPNIADIITSKVGSAIIRKAADAAISAAIRSDNPMDAGNVRSSRDAIEKEMAKEIAASPELQHVTNLEPWYQKRTRWSAIVSGVLVVAAPLIVKYTDMEIGTKEVELIVTVLTTVGGIVAGWLAYRAGTATRPLGA